jgi:hypothetical protein
VLLQNQIYDFGDKEQKYLEEEKDMDSGQIFSAGLLKRE